ncbi:tyrosine-type recombinase/integrase [Actinomyces faecalis]|uniref:tyrosine-type recombinase/integrase n=1 Tax=Actinomyces faecalis TaxID=2722820 RepID=UPI0015576F1B|nr:site-specific integrase [Actinomyces faecalis]
MASTGQLTLTLPTGTALSTPRRRRPTVRQVRRKDGSCRYQVRLSTYPGGPRVQESFPTAAAAESFCDLVTSLGAPAALAALDAADAATAVPTLRAWFATYLQQVASYATPGTVDGYRRVFARYLDRPLGSLLLTQVERSTVVAWVASMRASRAPRRKGAEPAPLSCKTIREAQRLLSQVLKAAVEEGLLRTNPARGVKVPDDDVKGERTTFLTRDELGVLIEAVDPYWRPLVSFLAGTGTRFGEATAVQVRDLDLGASPATVRICRAWKKGDGPGGVYLGGTKGATTRTVALPANLARALAVAVDGKASTDLVFTTREGGRVQSQHFSTRVWHPALRRAAEAGLTKAPRVHDLRHTHASLLLGAGVPIIAVQRRLGHKSITTTVDTYGHLTPDAYAAATDAAEAIVNVTSPAFASPAPSPDLGRATAGLAEQMEALRAQLSALSGALGAVAGGEVVDAEVVEDAQVAQIGA